MIKCVTVQYTRCADVLLLDLMSLFKCLVISLVAHVRATSSTTTPPRSVLVDTCHSGVCVSLSKPYINKLPYRSRMNYLRLNIPDIIPLNVVVETQTTYSQNLIKSDLTR